jgi:hypothetical protein
MCICEEEEEKKNTNHMSMLFRRQKRGSVNNIRTDSYTFFFSALPDGEYLSIVIM